VRRSPDGDLRAGRVGTDVTQVAVAPAGGGVASVAPGAVRFGEFALTLPLTDGAWTIHARSATWYVD
jgi:hypothetical protein